MVKDLKKFSHETRLKRLGIYSLDRRWLCGDLIETFKILTGKNVLTAADVLNWQMSAADFVDIQWNCLGQDVVQQLDRTASA